MSRVRWLAVCAALLLAACSGAFLPRSITLSEAELQAQLQRRFPLQRSLLELYDLQLSDPQLRLDAAANRLATELTLSGTERRNGRGLQGRMRLDYALRFEPADASVRLVQPRVQSLDFAPESGISSRRAEMAQRLGIALAERLLDDFVLYRVPVDRLQRLASAGLRPGALRVTQAGVEITFEPVDAAPSAAPRPV
jgi:hypothetical protein